MLHPDNLADVMLPNLPKARCADEWQLFDLALGRPNRNEVIDARSQAALLRIMPVPHPVPCLARLPAQAWSRSIAGW